MLAHILCDAGTHARLGCYYATSMLGLIYMCLQAAAPRSLSADAKHETPCSHRMLDSRLGWYSAQEGHELAVYEMSLERRGSTDSSKKREYIPKLWGRTAGRDEAVAVPIVPAGLEEGAFCMTSERLSTYSPLTN